MRSLKTTSLHWMEGPTQVAVAAAPPEWIECLPKIDALVLRILLWQRQSESPKRYNRHRHRWQWVLCMVIRSFVIYLMSTLQCRNVFWYPLSARSMICWWALLVKLPPNPPSPPPRCHDSETNMSKVVHPEIIRVAIAINLCPPSSPTDRPTETHVIPPNGRCI